MFWTHTGICRVLTSLVGAFFILTSVATMPAMAQFSIPCNSSAVYRPDIAAYGFSSVDIKGAISSSNPAVATGRRGREGGGTAGAIEIKSNGQSGETTITYTIEDFSGKTKQIVVAVVVDCESPGYNELAEVKTDCKECAYELRKLNVAIKVYNASRFDHTPAQLDAMLEEIGKLYAALLECEKNKCGPKEQKPDSSDHRQPPSIMQKPQAKRYPQPHRVITRCKDAACLAIQDKLNADIDAFNAALAAGKTPTDQLDAMLANINREGQELNACEKKCVPKQAAVPVPTAAPAAPPTQAAPPKPATPPPPASPPSSEYRPQDQVMIRGTGPNAGVVLSFDPVEYASGTTTFTTALDKMTVKYHTEQAEFGGMAYAGPAFAYVKATVGFDPNGNSTDVFAGGGTFTSNVHTGMTGSVNVVGGYSVWQTPTTSFGFMGGYYGSTESLYGSVPGGITQFPIMTDTWNAGQVGVFLKQSFTAGNVPLQFWGSVTGLWDRLHSGAFTGDGGGLKANATLSFPLGPVRGRITAQYTDLNASGNVLGLSQKVDTQNWYVGAGISAPFGALSTQ